MCRWWVLSLMLIQPIFMVANVGADTQQKMYHVNIVAGTVAESLNQLSEQINIPVFFSYAIVKSRQANAVSGQYTLHDVLEIMLQGTGLHGGLSNKGVLTISLGDLEASYNQGEDMMNRKKNILASTIAFFMGSGAGVVSAVDQNQVEELNHQGIDEIVVTAQKREQRLVDVPISVSVMGEDELKKRSIQDLRDLSFHVPNFTIAGSGSGSQIPIIRGVRNVSGSSSLVGIYLDEIALPTVTGLGFEVQTDDIQNVEVLKGPQGTLFGQGAMGGVVRFVSNKPSFEGVEGVLRTSGSATEGGDFSQEYTAVVNMPVVDDVFALRLNATYKDLGGWIDTINPSIGETITENANDKQVSNFNLKGLWQPTDDLSVDILAIQYKSDAGLDNRASKDSKFPLIVRNGQPFYNTDISYDYDIYGLTITYDLGFATLTSASSSFDTVQEKSSNTNLGAFTSGPPITNLVTDLVNEIKGINQELRLTGASTDTGLNWMVGVFFNQYEYGLNGDVTVYRNGDALAQFINNPGIEDSESMAYFIDTSYAITKQLTLGIGIRYFEDDREINSGFNLGVENSLDPATLQKATFDKVSSKIALSYAPNDNSNIYLRVAEGFRSGGLNPDDSLLYDPESLLAYELGFKTATDRLSAEGNLYYSIYDDYQGFVFSPSLPSGFGTTNAGEAEIKGFEWLLQWKVDEQWYLGFNGHVTESEFTSLRSGFSAAQVGDPLDAIAKYSYGVSVDYAFNWSSSVAGSAHLAYNRQGPTTTTARGAPFARGNSIESDATGYLNMRVGAEWDDFTLSFFGKNLTNEKRPNILVLITDFNDVQSRPRELGVDLSYRF